jgi:Mg2+-importing ATPase
MKRKNRVKNQDKKITDDHLLNFWSFKPEEILEKLHARPEGLKQEEVRERLKQYGKNALDAKKTPGIFKLLLSQFNTPIIYLLLFAATLALILYDRTDALILFGIIIVSAILSFIQERSALQAVEKLLNMVKIKTNVLRNNAEAEILLEEVIPGDILLLKGGDIIPADCYLLEVEGLQVDESTLTGESNAAEKQPGVIPPDTPIAKHSNSLFMGTHVISGSGKAVAVFTGKQTEFGKVSNRLKQAPPENAFEKGVRQFGYFLLVVTLILISFIFVFNIYFGRPLIESLLFSLALAVGLTPQLLPAIITINLAHGAQEMATKKVIVKKLVAIENFGSMNILCADKTGTLTEGKLQVKAAVDSEGKESEKVMLYAFLNASFQGAYKNPIDQCLLDSNQLDISGWKKLDEIPYDFNRKRISVLVKKEKSQLMLSKGAIEQVFEICSKVETADGKATEFASMQDQLEERFAQLSKQGNRVLGIACKNVEGKQKLDQGEEKEMTFVGFLLFFDPLKKDIQKSLEHLKKMGISMKMITGDNRYIAMHLAQEIGLTDEHILTGPELANMNEEELRNKVKDVDIFAEIEPNQKEKIILALRSNDQIVGYLGDGINDVTALHSADVSISVNSAADAAKEVADIVLLKKHLDVLRDGVLAGRKTFANTLKYVFMTTSANFGNMFSMAGASLFLNFLPLLPKQILLTNLMTDFPEMTIATDHVDKEMIEKPKRWDVRFIRNFMIVFGLISSLFDYLTFGVLLWLLKASEVQFRTGWFMESVISASVIVLVIRTFKSFYSSMPSIYLLSAVLLVTAATVALPYTPLAPYLGFQPLPAYFLFYIATILVLYILSVEVAKRVFNFKYYLKKQ